MSGVDVAKGLGQDAVGLVKFYVANPTEENRELIIKYLQAIDEIRVKLGGNNVDPAREAEMNQKIADFKRSIDAFLLQAVSIFSAYPNMKSFKYVDNLIRTVKKLA